MVVSFVSDIPESSVAFTVYASVQRFYEIGEIIIFDGVLTNEGNHYQTHSSFFICPKEGLYMFTTTICGGLDDEDFEAFLMKEAQSFTTARAHVDHLDQGIASAVMHCEEGERVWVKVSGTQDIGELYSTETERVASFAGFLIEF